MDVSTSSSVSSDFGASIRDFMKSNCSLIEEVIIQISDFTVFIRLCYFHETEFHNRSVCL